MNLGLQVSASVDKSEAIESDSCGAVGVDQPWLDVKDEGIKESVSLIVMSEVLIVKCYLNLKDIWLSVSWDQCLDLVVSNLLTLL